MARWTIILIPLVFVVACSRADTLEIREDTDVFVEMYPGLKGIESVSWTIDKVTDDRVPGPSGFHVVAQGTLSAAMAEDWRHRTGGASLPLTSGAKSAPDIGVKCGDWLSSSLLDTALNEGPYSATRQLRVWICEEGDAFILESMGE